MKRKDLHHSRMITLGSLCNGKKQKKRHEEFDRRVGRTWWGALLPEPCFSSHVDDVDDVTSAFLLHVGRVFRTP